MKPSKNFLSRRKLTPGELPEIYRRLLKAFGHRAWWPGDTPFEIIVGAILTQNTAWTNVEKALLNLKRAGKLTVKAMHGTKASTLARLIRPAGYFNVKAKRLKHFTDFLTRRYGGSLAAMFRQDAASLRQELLGVNGIGPETADSILLYAGGKLTFVMDAYTKRIFSRHGLHDFEADYHEWQRLFHNALPPKVSLYNDFHAQIVELGKRHCKATRFDCEGCPLASYL
ncbi:MAG TPA: endonuclease III domain-containing protein [Verrucomicrobiae bacterium]|nr:endonuclease III domain-containing protein [Verrucomicrobiae bacterium]